jgi:F0F1-type ATP synthase assembly protein I
MIILEIIWFVVVSLVKAIFRFLFSWCYGIFGWMLVIAIVLGIIRMILNIRSFIGYKKRAMKKNQKEKALKETRKK